MDRGAGGPPVALLADGMVLEKLLMFLLLRCAIGEDFYKFVHGPTHHSHDLVVLQTEF
jgi:hypothetical protein